jgi:hypothetical protein
MDRNLTPLPKGESAAERPGGDENLERAFSPAAQGLWVDRDLTHAGVTAETILGCEVPTIELCEFPLVP